MALEPSIITILLSLIALWLLVTNIILFRLLKRYHRLTQGIKKKELRDLLENAQSKIVKQKKATDELTKWMEKLEKEEESHVQKVGFVRFNPFSDTGGDQSFCLALLDGHQDGIVISSLHSREQTRIYAKAIVKGKTIGQELSKEEKQALEKAQKGQ